MTNTELFKTLSKQWANVNDIKKIANCGRDNASVIRDEIISNIKKDGKKLPIAREKIVPMTYVINYLDLDIEHISLMATKEKNI